MKRLWITLAAATLTTLAVSARNPNIIYILADDLGYGDLSCLGQQKFKTPHIDSLAKEGMIFTQHYSGSTVCAPSRCSLLTGLHTGHCFVRGNAEVMPEGQASMPASTRTVAHLLQEAGYATGIFGKWGLGSPGSDSEPLKMGFERFYGYNCQRMAHHYYPYFLWSDNQREMLWNNFGLETGDYAPDLIQTQVLKFIEENRERPFFCYYALIQPHAEMFAPEEYMRKYRGKFLPETEYKGTDGGPSFRKGPYGSQAESHAAFAAMVGVMDDDIGELKAKLRQLGIDKETLIIFTSDNGTHVEGGHNPAYFNSSGSRRGTKRDLYEGGIHVPMIACWPGKIRAGATTAHLSAFWDILPTFAEIAGAETPKGLDGISFLPTLLNYPGQKQHDYLYWEFHEQRGRVAIRQGQWKGVRYNVAVNPDSPLELYDLSNDPGEEHNVAAQNPEVVRNLDRLLKQARIASHTPKFNFPRPTKQK
jgi:arylsulfatase A